MNIKLVTCIFFVLSFTLNAQDKIKFVNTVETAGDLLEIGLPATALTVSIIKEDWKGVKQFALSSATNFTVTRLMKNVIDKDRPNNPYNTQGFPSGHTSSSFQGASFIQRRYGWKYGKYAYLVSAFVGYSRIESNNHDIWDVMAGAALGVGSTYIYTTPYKKNKIELGFSSYEDYKILGLSCKF